MIPSCSIPRKRPKKPRVSVAWNEVERSRLVELASLIYELVKMPIRHLDCIVSHPQE